MREDVATKAGKLIGFVILAALILWGGVTLSQDDLKSLRVVVPIAGLLLLLWWLLNRKLDEILAAVRRRN